MTRQSSKGPWLKVYISALDTKAHYTDAQFRALVEVWMHAVRQPVRGLFANRSAIDRRVGSDHVDFLVEQGDLELLANSSVAVHKWTDYQSGVLSTERGSRLKENSSDPVDNSSGTVPEHAISREARAGDSTLLEDVVDGTDVIARDDDPIAIVYLTTNDYPNSPKVKRWIEDVAGRGPSPRDFGVIFPGEWAVSGYKLDVALKSTSAKLSAMTDRAAAAKAKEPKSVDPLLARQRAAYEARYGPEGSDVTVDPDPAAIAAGRAAFDSLRGSFGSKRGGLPVRTGDVLRSRQGGQTKVLTDVGTPGSPVPTRGPVGGTPSPRATAVRPSASGPPEASTDEARKEM